MERCVTKPRGYAGDYLTIDAMYRNTPAGDGALGRYLDRCALEFPTAQAVRNRRALLQGAMNDVAKENRTPWPTRITSLASGPAREVFDLLTDASAPDVRITCVDMDPGAIAHASRTAGELGVADRVTLVRENIINLCHGKSRTALESQHLIYSIGLADYLIDREVVALLDWIHGQLLPNGTVILGNFDVSNPARAFMDYVFQWPLIYRTADDLRRLIGWSKFGDAAVDIRTEDEGINLFAFCVKQ